MLEKSTWARFDNLVPNILWPNFKTRGYKKTESNFRFYCTDSWGEIINVHKNAFSDKNKISFTINTGLYLPEADIIFETPRGDKFLKPDCLVRKLIGNLNELGADHWCNLDEKNVAWRALRHNHPRLFAIRSSLFRKDSILWWHFKTDYTGALAQWRKDHSDAIYLRTPR